MPDLERKYGNAAGRWASFGPYYATFPVSFAKEVVSSMSSKGGSILDPFCGRGTVPFVAQATERSSLGIDINPVAWIFSKVKTSPTPEPKKLLDRLDGLSAEVSSSDKQAVNEFQKLAWSQNVLGFLNAARRTLNWRDDTIDRTLMAFILVNLHGRGHDGIGNQMQKSRAMGPVYALKWWKDRGLKPPDVNPYEYFHKRICWRYRYGVIGSDQASEILCADSTQALPNLREERFDLLFTSPPYFGITDYRQDSWIRLWMLREGGALPDWKKDKAMVSKDHYGEMLKTVFAESSRLLKRNGVVWIRTDAREYTRKTTLDAIHEVWPNRKLYQRCDLPQKATQTAHFGRESSGLGEVDFVIPGKRPLPFSGSYWEQL